MDISSVISCKDALTVTLFAIFIKRPFSEEYKIYPMNIVFCFNILFNPYLNTSLRKLVLKVEENFSSNFNVLPF